MTDRELQARREILAAFAATGRPPAEVEPDVLRSLADQHVVALDGPEDSPRILMAHPFASHRDGTRVEAGGHTWWGNCAWDGLGIVAALRLAEATVVSNGVEIAVRDGVATGDGLFHVAVPARDWWADIGFT